MGVMLCDRKNCDNVMCDRYSSVFGYICYDCYRELKDLRPTSILEVKKFMASSKGCGQKPSNYLDLSEIFILD